MLRSREPPLLRVSRREEQNHVRTYHRDASSNFYLYRFLDGSRSRSRRKGSRSNGDGTLATAVDVVDSMFAAFWDSAIGCW